MNKYFVFFFSLVVLFFYSCTTKEATSLIDIVIDPSQKERIYDLARDVEPDFSIVALETSDSSLLGYIENIKYANDKYYILDNNSIIYIFDNEGKYVSKLNKIGRAPEEYGGIGDFVVVGQNLWIYDNMNFRLSCYDQQFTKVEEVHLDMAIDHIVYAGDCIYGAANWSGYREENYQIIEYNIPKEEIKKLMPFPAQSQEFVLIGLDCQLAVNGDSCLFMQSFCDTLFHLKNGQVTPRYTYSFTERYLNERLSYAESRKQEEAGTILGINAIYQTPNSVIILYGDNKMPKFAFYNKNSGSCQVYDGQFINSALGELKTMQPFFTPNHELITFYTPDTFMNFSHVIMDRKKFKNPEDLQKIEDVIKGLKEDDNPVLFKYKLNSDSQL